MVAFHLFTQALELAAAYVLEIYTVGTRGRRFVEKHRDAVALPKLVAHVPREGDAIFDGHPFDGNKRQHVRCAHARMRSRVLGHVDQLDRLARAQDRRFRDGIGSARQRDDAAIVVGVQLAVEHVDASHCAHRRHQRVHLRCVTPLGKVGHAFNQSFHRLCSSP